MFSLLKYLFNIQDEKEKETYSNHWEELIKKNTKYNTILIDWEFNYCDLLIFNCSQHQIKVEYDSKSIRIESYLGCEGSSPGYASFNLTDKDTIKITCNDKIINKKIYPKTILYLEDKDLSDD